MKNNRVNYTAPERHFVYRPLNFPEDKERLRIQFVNRDLPLTTTAKRYGLHPGNFHKWLMNEDAGLSEKNMKIVRQIIDDYMLDWEEVLP